MPQHNHVKDLFQSFVNFSALVIGIGSGVAQLAGVPKGAGRAALGVLGVCCILFLVVRYWRLFYLVRAQELQVELTRVKAILLATTENAQRELANAAQQLSSQQQAHNVYVQAIERIIDHEVALYDESLEIVVNIGDDDRDDTIVEKRLTTPHRKVMHRAIRPIVPSDEEWTTVRMDEIDFTVDVPGDDIFITALPLVEKPHYLRTWLVFESGITREMKWQVEYRPNGLWRPFRSTGKDRLGWTDRPPTGNGDVSALSRITFKFIFPRDEFPPIMEEERNFGVFADPRRLEGSERWLIEWTDAAPAGRRYVWHMRKRR